MSNLRRIKGRQSPRMRRWSMLDSGTRPLLDWVREQRETFDWAAEERRASGSISSSQSVHGTSDRQARLVEEERMTQSMRGLSSTRNLDDIRRNPLEMGGNGSGAPLDVVNVNTGLRSTMSVDNSELHSISEREGLRFTESEDMRSAQGDTVSSQEELVTTQGKNRDENMQTNDNANVKRGAQKRANIVVTNIMQQDALSATPESVAEEPEVDERSVSNEGSSIARAQQIMDRRGVDRMQKTTLGMLQNQTAQNQERARAATQASRMQAKLSVTQLISTRSSEEPQPDLIPSTTEDTDERSSINGIIKEAVTLRDALAQDNAEVNYGRDQQSRREAIEYLLHYETMVLQQEAEEIATMTYIRPLLNRLNALGKGESNISDPTKTNDSLYNDLCQRCITYGELKQALNLLENESPTSSTSDELLTRDKQLMMVLRLLTQKHSSAEAAEEVNITWAEIIHCYRVCVLGMSTLKHMPKEGNSKVVRSRAKDRILSQLSLFELPATKLMNEERQFDSGALDTGMDQKENQTKMSPRIRHRNILAVATVFVAASMLGFLTGSKYSSTATPKETKEAPSDFNTPMALPAPEQYDEAQRIDQIQFCPAQAPEVRPEDVLSNNAQVPSSSVRWEAPKLRATLPRTLPRTVPPLEEESDLFDVKAMPVADLKPVVEALGDLHATKQRGFTHQTKTRDSKQPLWLSLSPSQQAAASALVGVTTGVMAPPRIMVLYQSVSSALSLGSLGVLPATLVVVGAIAVGVNVVKGVHFAIHRLLRMRGL